ncbi:MAG: YesL family protein [Lachnospiraceae bacterium]|nr:YesL family protein [Lachnospiraceae bacterium]
MKIFDIDSPLMNVLGKISDLVILNLVTLVMCIPIVTAGASFTAMHYCCLKIARDRETGILKLFFHSFKDNLRQSTAMWLLFLVIVAIFVIDCIFMYTNPTNLSSYVFGGLIFCMLLVLFIGCMVFPIQARFVNTITGTIKNAFVFSFKYFPRTLAILVVKLLPFSLFFIGNGNLGISLFPLIFCFCFSAPGFLAAKLYDKPFQKFEDAYNEAHPAESYDEEKIFNDVPDENS